MIEIEVALCRAAVENERILIPPCERLLERTSPQYSADEPFGRGYDFRAGRRDFGYPRAEFRPFYIAASRQIIGFAECCFVIYGGNHGSCNIARVYPVHSRIAAAEYRASPGPDGAAARLPIIPLVAGPRAPLAQPDWPFGRAWLGGLERRIRARLRAVIERLASQRGIEVPLEGLIVSGISGEVAERLMDQVAAGIAAHRLG